MDLSKPQYEIRHEYDNKIFDLQKNIEELEKQFGFSKDQPFIPNFQTYQQETKTKKKVTINPSSTKAKLVIDEEEQPQLMRPVPIPLGATNTKYLNTQSKQNRYTNLISIKPEHPKMVKKNPEISEKWPEVFAQKPDLMRFYNKDEFNPVNIDKQDFQTNIHLKKENDVFNEYMDTFALCNL